MAVWVIRAGRGGKLEDHALQNGVCGVGFYWQQNASEFVTREELRDHLQKIDAEQHHRSSADQLWRFANEVETGDIVVMPRKWTKIVAIGTITGHYKHDPDGKRDFFPHTRKVEWRVQDAPKANFDLDLVSSFNSRLTISQVGRDNAEVRIEQAVNAYLGEELTVEPLAPSPSPEPTDDDTGVTELEEYIDPRIIERIRQKFQRHDLEYFVESILKAEGYNTLRTERGPDGGADILAGSGAMGLDSPKLCVQVKSGRSPVGIEVYNRLQGNVHGFGADYGLLVSSSGFKQSVIRESRRRFFEIRLWGPDELVEKLLETYDDLPLHIRTAIPLQTRRMLVE